MAVLDEDVEHHKLQAQPQLQNSTSPVLTPHQQYNPNRPSQLFSAPLISPKTVVQDKKSKVAQELAAHKQQMRGGGLALSQGTRRILQERQRHTLKASQAAAAMTASGLLNQVTI